MSNPPFHTSPTPPPTLGLLASLAARLPDRERTPKAFLALFGLLGVCLALLALGGKSMSMVLAAPLLAAAGVAALSLFFMVGLLQWRSTIKAWMARTGGSGEFPGLWRLFLAPYRKADVDHMAATGRLPELMAFSMIMIIVSGLVIAALVGVRPAGAQPM
ncbi:hypothetical protein FBZ87_1262 [Nitrospirillum amazonense]|uniref:Uncharacterized protein n=1 Tax=Nitrospirillum amazonense TaxID=28077 RepID=A0A560J4F8_9PROT|nr:hypothetical protein [Nitrospirillum amazonense]TWB64104.1 hypothetical protein FBZ87_1262 [Nitrospirillum amazonense]